MLVYQGIPAQRVWLQATVQLGVRCPISQGVYMAKDGLALHQVLVKLDDMSRLCLGRLPRRRPDNATSCTNVSRLQYAMDVTGA